MLYLRQSTASQVVPLGPFVDSTDGVTAKTALTIANTDIKIQVRNATTLASKNSGGATHIATGNYYATFDATDTATAGSARIIVQVSGALPYVDDVTILPTQVFDSIVLGTDLLQVDTEQFANSNLTATAGIPSVNVTQNAGSAISAASGIQDVNVTKYGGTAGTFAAGIPTVTVGSTGINAIADQVWDEVASGHVAAGSFGAANYVIRSGTAQAGAATTITLDASASAVNDFYKYQRIAIVSGTGVGQGNIISGYVGATKVASVTAWGTNPDNTSVFSITPLGAIPGATAPSAATVAAAVWDEAAASHTTSGSYGQYVGGSVVQTGTAQAGTTSSITLASGASTTDDRYKYQEVTVISGTGFGQTGQITAYTGSTRVATVAPSFAVAPDNTSVYLVTPLGIDAATVATIAAGVWNEVRASHITAGTFGEYVLSDAIKVSGNQSAADNLQSAFDGTGYTATGLVVPTVTSVGSVSGAVGSVSGSVGSVVGNVGGNVVGSVASVTGTVGGNVTGSVGSVTGAVGSVTGNVGGNVTGSVGSVVANVNADIKKINGTTVNGDGSATPWGP